MSCTGAAKKEKLEGELGGQTPVGKQWGTERKVLVGSECWIKGRGNSPFPTLAELFDGSEGCSQEIPSGSHHRAGKEHWGGAGVSPEGSCFLFPFPFPSLFPGSKFSFHPGI